MLQHDAGKDSPRKFAKTKQTKQTKHTRKKHIAHNNKNSNIRATRAKTLFDHFWNYCQATEATRVYHMPVVRHKVVAEVSKIGNL